MTGGRPRRLLGPTVGASGLLAFTALVIWVAAVLTSWGGGCPNAEFQDPTGLDRGISSWPPGAQCATDPTSHDVFTHQALPWATWAIVTLLVGAATVLLFGLLISIRDLRRGGAEASQALAAELAASDAEWYRQDPRVAVAGDDERRRDPPAIAA